MLQTHLVTYFGSSAFFIQDTICPLKQVLRRNLDKHVTLHYTYVGDSFPHSMSVFTQDIICPLKHMLCSKQFAMLDKHIILCAGDGFSHLMPLRMTKTKQNFVLFFEHWGRDNSVSRVSDWKASCNTDVGLSPWCGKGQNAPKVILSLLHQLLCMMMMNIASR